MKDVFCPFSHLREFDVDGSRFEGPLPEWLATCFRARPPLLVVVLRRLLALRPHAAGFFALPLAAVTPTGRSFSMSEWGWVHSAAATSGRRWPAFRCPTPRRPCSFSAQSIALSRHFWSCWPPSCHAPPSFLLYRHVTSPLLLLISRRSLPPRAGCVLRTAQRQHPEMGQEVSQVAAVVQGAPPPTSAALLAAAPAPAASSVDDWRGRWRVRRRRRRAP